MRGFRELNPAVIMTYYLCVIGTAMFCMDPVIVSLSLVGAVMLFVTIDIKHRAGLHISFFLLFLILALINPIFYHNGVTVLFVVNDSPITLEAAAYGVTAAAMIISVLYRFRTFTMIMTADKLMYVFGKLSPKISLILSMALRYVPMMRKQTAKVRNTQKALGIYRGDNIADTIKGEARIFSIMTTWSLENGIITADSMEARGYGTKRRSNFSVFRFTAQDGVFLAVFIALTGAVTAAIACGDVGFTFYPEISGLSGTVLSDAGYASYGLLSVMPAVIEWKEELRWKYLISKI